ncbi:MAG: aminotransferase class I/II-fold pyridoxal phosphate-dependent enzyme, partial [Gemmatimonadota bacterium]
MTLYEESDVAASSVNRGLEERLRTELAAMRDEGVYKELLHIMGRQSAVVDIDGFGETINLCSNNYLGLCDDASVMRAVEEGVEHYGAGTSSVRFICGTFEIHRRLETKIAEFLEMPASLTYTSCWNANEGLFAPLLGPE